MDEDALFAGAAVSFGCQGPGRAGLVACMLTYCLACLLHRAPCAPCPPCAAWRLLMRTLWTSLLARCVWLAAKHGGACSQAGQGACSQAGHGAAALQTTLSPDTTPVVHPPSLQAQQAETRKLNALFASAAEHLANKEASDMAGCQMAYVLTKMVDDHIMLDNHTIPYYEKGTSEKSFITINRSCLMSVNKHGVPWQKGGFKTLVSKPVSVVALE